MSAKKVAERYLLASTGWNQTLKVLVAELENNLKKSIAGPWKFTPSVTERFINPTLRMDVFGKRKSPLVGIPHVGVHLKGALNEKNPYGIKQDSVNYGFSIAITDSGSIYKLVFSKVTERSVAQLVEDSVEWIHDYEVRELQMIEWKKTLSPPKVTAPKVTPPKVVPVAPARVLPTVPAVSAPTPEPTKPQLTETDIIDTVKDAVHTVCRRLGWMTGGVDVEGKTVTGSYRSDRLPKEVGDEYEYEDLFELETQKVKKILNSRIDYLMPQIKSVYIEPEEKSWVYITITLK